MTFTPLKVGSPANDLLTLNRLFNKARRDLPAVPSDVRFARMWHSNALVTAGPSIVIRNSSVFPYGSYWQQFPLADNGDTFRHYFSLSSGTYDFGVLANTYDNAANVEFKVDGVIIGAIDLYSAVEADKVPFTIANVTITTDGTHELQGQAKGKNASSLGYNVRLYKYFFREA